MAGVQEGARRRSEKGPEGGGGGQGCVPAGPGKTLPFPRKWNRGRYDQAQVLTRSLGGPEKTSEEARDAGAGGRGQWQDPADSERARMGRTRTRKALRSVSGMSDTLRAREEFGQ